MDVCIEGEGILALCTPCIQDAAEAAGLTFNEALVRDLTAERDDFRRAVAAAAEEDERFAREIATASRNRRKASR